MSKIRLNNGKEVDKFVAVYFDQIIRKSIYSRDAAEYFLSFYNNGNFEILKLHQLFYFPNNNESGKAEVKSLLETCTNISYITTNLKDLKYKNPFNVELNYLNKLGDQKVPYEQYNEEQQIFNSLNYNQKYCLMLLNLCLNNNIDELKKLNKNADEHHKAIISQFFDGKKINIKFEPIEEFKREIPSYILEEAYAEKANYTGLEKN